MWSIKITHLIDDSEWYLWKITACEYDWTSTKRFFSRTFKKLTLNPKIAQTLNRQDPKAQCWVAYFPFISLAKLSNIKTKRASFLTGALTQHRKMGWNSFRIRVLTSFITKVLFTDHYTGKNFVYEFCVLCILVNRLYTVIHNTQNS